MPSPLRGTVDFAISQPCDAAAWSSSRSAEIDGIVAAIEGHPQFTGPLAVVARERGAAAALVHGYQANGAGLFDDLHGTFAFALVDRGRREALLAVDRLGVNTLCFHAGDDRLHFGTDAGDVAASLSGVGTPAAPRLDPQALFAYLYFHCIPAPMTVYAGVGRLLPGHRIRVVDGRVAVEPYWQADYRSQVARATPALEREFLDIVRSSVERSVEGAHKPACFLSGGTDSSTVAGMLTSVLGAPAPTYSIGFDAEGFDEVRFARIASKHFGTSHHEYYITPADLVAGIPKIAASYDQPFGNSSVLPTYYCARMAAADGVDRMLGGDGGDELFGGNTRYAKQRVFDHFDRAPGFVRGALQASLAPAFWSRVPVVGKARSYVQQARVPMPDRMQTYNLLMRIGPATILEPAFLARVDPTGPAALMRGWYERSNADNLVDRMLDFDAKFTLTDNDLPKVVNACRVGGTDVAFPLLDDRLVAFANALGPDLKLKGYQLRWFFKHALRNFLPAEILTKSKHGFGLPFGIWLRRDAALNALAFESLEGLKGRGIVRADFIDLLRADLVSDHAMFYGEFVWILMMLEQWLRAHAPDAKL